MSEDESDHEGKGGMLQGRRFKIVKVQWRSPEATKWLRTMDLIYAGTRINEDQTSGPGNQFRQRYQSMREHAGHPIIGLPRNFYDERWLKSLSPHEREQLRMQPDIDINFSAEERRFVPLPLHQYRSHSHTLMIHLIFCRRASRSIGIKGQLQEDRVASSAEADKDRISEWVLTGAGFWEMA